MYYQQVEGEPVMNLHDKRVKIIAAVLAILLIVIGVRIFMNVMSAKEKAEKAKQGKVVTVATGIAKRETIKPVLSFAGNLDPVWQAKVAPKLAGRIQRHRKQNVNKENLFILNQNIRALQKQTVAFTKPGFEGNYKSGRHLSENKEIRNLI